MAINPRPSDSSRSNFGFETIAGLTSINFPFTPVWIKIGSSWPFTLTAKIGDVSCKNWKKRFYIFWDASDFTWPPRFRFPETLFFEWSTFSETLYETDSISWSLIGWSGCKQLIRILFECFKIRTGPDKR